MSSPGPYDDPFVSGSDDGWDPYGGIRSQEHTQVNEVESTQIAGQDSNPNDDQLSTLRYSIKWKVTFNRRSILEDTEQDVALAPAIYWGRSLRSELGAAVRESEQTRQKALKSEGGSVDVSVSKHGQKKFTKPYKDTDINWAIIENQLLKWGDFFHEGKVLNLDLTFKYVEDPQPFSAAPRGRNNRGRYVMASRRYAERNSWLCSLRTTSGAQVSFVDGSPVICSDFVEYDSMERGGIRIGRVYGIGFDKRLAAIKRDEVIIKIQIWGTPILAATS
jgi:hypothetical protein